MWIGPRLELEGPADIGEEIPACRNIQWRYEKRRSQFG